MKKFVKSLRAYLEAMGRARAATVLSRQGRHEEAKRLLLEN